MELSEDEKIIVQCAILDKILSIKQYLYKHPNDKTIETETTLNCLKSVSERLCKNEL